MGLLDSIIGSVAGNSGVGGDKMALVSTLGSLLEQNGGVQGLMGKFSAGGLGGVFSSWVGNGQNQGISAEQIESVLGSSQVQALAAKLGIDPSMAAGFLAKHLPAVVDKLTPAGQVDPAADHQQGLMAMLPSLLESLGGSKQE